MSNKTDQVKIARIILGIFITIYGIGIIVQFVFGIRLQNRYDATMDNLYDYYFVSVEDIIRLDWALYGDYILYKSLLWSASLGLLTCLFSIPEKRTDSYSKHVVVCLAIVGIIRTVIGVVGTGVGNRKLSIKTELSLNFEHYMEFEENRAIQIFMEEEHKCCGIVGPSDYNKFNVSEYPNSCYHGVSLSLIGCPERVVNLYTEAMTNFGLLFILTGLYEGVCAIPAYYLHHYLNMPEATPVAVPV